MKHDVDIVTLIIIVVLVGIISLVARFNIMIPS